MPFDGDLDDYLAWLAARRSAQAAGAAATAAAVKPESRQARAAAHARREDKLARRRPLLKESEQLERKLARWQEEQRALDAQLAGPAFDAGPDNQRYAERLARQAEVARLIEGAEQRWLEVHAEIEDIGEL